MDEDDRIASLAAVPTDSTLLFRVREDGEVREAILLAVDDDEVVAWYNECQHWTDVGLDGGSGAAIRADEIVCTRHGATFEIGTGYCTFGPCEGAMLDRVDVAVADGAVYLADPTLTYVGRGGTDRDPDDLGGGSRIGFGGT